MTVSSEAKRTLVKSPPELWSEVSDPESLARHLDGLEQIRITRTEPETAVEWEADGASGSVRLQPSGFGTKVTLSLSRELTAAEPIATESEPANEPSAENAPLADPEPVAEPVTAPVAGAEPESPASGPAITQLHAEPSEVTPDDVEPDIPPIAAEPDALAIEPDLVESEPSPAPSTDGPFAAETPREGFFARLFKRRRKPTASADESDDPTDESEPAALAEPEPIAAVELEPIADAEPEPVASSGDAESKIPSEATIEPLTEPAAVTETDQADPDSEPAYEPGRPPVASVTADLATLEAQMAEQDEAMLTAMLDRLGAAHHRPFSRA